MRNDPVKFLKLFLYIHIASLVNHLLGFLPVFGNVLINRAVTAGVIYCLFSLAAHGARYKKAAIFRTVFLISGFLGGVIPVLAGSVCSIIASWQEYHGHSELVGSQDEKLSKNWNSLFTLELLISIFIAVATSVISVVVFRNGGNGIGTDHIGNQLIIALGYIIDVLYLIYMKRTIQLHEV